MKGVLQVAALALFGSVLLRWLYVHYCAPGNESYPSDLTEEQVAGHVPLRQELSDFIQDGGFQELKQFIQVLV